MHGRVGERKYEECIQSSGRKISRDHFKDIGIAGRIILNLKVTGERVWTWFISLRVRTASGLL
jgi:hypothetical protein